MNTEQALWNVVINLPESLKKELLHYAEYLREKDTENKQYQKKIEVTQRYGSWAGQIIMSDDFDEPVANISPVKRPLKRGSAKSKVWMSDDFDEPLEDFKEYME